MDIELGWRIGEKRRSEVNLLKLIRDLREQFPYDALTSLVVETFANSLDAEATKISIKLGNGIYEILDNGKGMDEQEFEEYHNIASLTKERGGKIGFAGIGAKVYLDKASYIITETKSESFWGASRWGFENGILMWEFIKPRGLISFNSGTYVKVIIRDRFDAERLNSEFVENVIKEHYNACLLGYYKVKEVLVNYKTIKPYLIPSHEIEHKKDINVAFTVKGRRYRVKGYIIKSREEIPDSFQGISIVVWGKSVTREWFKQTPLTPEKISGMLIADFLDKILTTSKSDFNREDKLWKCFYREIAKEVSNWLQEVGLRPTPPPMTPAIEYLAKDLEKNINKILKDPEFKELANILFQNVIRKSVCIYSKKGELLGRKVDGSQKTTGTIGGSGEGRGVLTFGNEEGKGIKEDREGVVPIERVKRYVKGGIKIGFANQPDNPLEGWVDVGTGTLTINTAAPSWKIAFGLSLSTGYDEVITYHLLRVVVRTLIEELGKATPESKMMFMKFLNAWYMKVFPSWLRAKVESGIA